jgi:hypothetical protein
VQRIDRNVVNAAPTIISASAVAAAAQTTALSLYANINNNNNNRKQHGDIVLMNNPTKAVLY